MAMVTDSTSSGSPGPFARSPRAMLYGGAPPTMTGASDSGRRPPATEGGRRRAPMRFRTEPTGPAVSRALRALTFVYLALPLFALAAAVDRPAVRSPTALWLTLAFAVTFAVTMALDHRRLRRGALAGFVPGRTFAQVVLATAAAVCAGLAFGLHGGTFLLLPVVTFLVAALVGNRAMIWRAWLVLTTGLALETALQLPAYDALWATVLFATTAGLMAAMVVAVVRGSIGAMARSRQLAELATETSAMADWPRDLAVLGERLARLMDVRRYAVLARVGKRAPIERAYAWPDADWPTWEALGDLPRSSLDSTGPLRTDSLVAAPARTGTDVVVVVVCPSTSRPGVPTEPTVVATVASLLAAMLTRSRLISGLMEAANTDELTGVANRRRLFEALAHEMTRARRSKLSLTVAMIDLDHFKAYNDAFGHSAGDELLQRFTSRVSSRVRSQDLLTRYGGEEFCLVLPETDMAGALALADGLRAEGAGQDRLGRRVTFSAGLATWDGTESADELVFRADASLYRAKAAGRDRVSASASASTPASAPGT